MGAADDAGPEQLERVGRGVALEQVGGVELAEETTQIDPQAGMDAMSAKFREMGGQVYVEADKVKTSNKALV